MANRFSDTKTLPELIFQTVGAASSPNLWDSEGVFNDKLARAIAEECLEQIAILGYLITPTQTPTPAPTQTPTQTPTPVISETGDDPDPAHHSTDPNDPDPAHHQGVKTPASVTAQPPTAAESSIEFSTPNWLAEWTNDVLGYVRELVAQNVGKTLVLVPYYVPGRDSGNFSAGGAPDEKTFLDFYQKIATSVGSANALAIVEPDALGLSLDPNHFDPLQKQERINMIGAAVRILRACPNLKIYVDASMWVSPGDMAFLLKQISNPDGFSLNVSGYAKLEDCIAYGDQLASLTGLSYVVDTSRNGNGNPHAPAWCNVTETKVGLPSSNVTPSRNCDFLVWAKVPGESDGLQINGDGTGPVRDDIPTAGMYWSEYHDAIYSGDWKSFHAKYHA